MHGVGSRETRKGVREEGGRRGEKGEEGRERGGRERGGRERGGREGEVEKGGELEWKKDKEGAGREGRSY